jgi:hypothetical protein
MTRKQLESIGQTYRSKLLKPRAWLRLLTLKTDYRLLWRSVVSSRRQPASAPPLISAPTEQDNASPLFPPAFFEMLRTRRPMLLVFGGGDRLHFEFEEKFISRHRARLAELPSVYDVHVVPSANHVLSADAWQREMLDVSARWLERHFLASAESAPAHVASVASPI